ncbi:MAG: PAS domain S-box protein [Dehalococcoidia bacterium]|nr:PAS domain S-box protein [Dehalococcoidia bacterium]
MAKGATQRKFEALVEHCPLALVITDQSGRIVLVNRETERMFGYGRAELLGQAVEILVPERLRRGHVRRRDGYLASSSMSSLGANRCLLGRRQDGTEFPTEIGLSYVETGDGILVMSTIADASQRRQADEALRNTGETLQALVQASPVGIAILDPDGSVEMWNPAAERMFGWSAGEVLGRPLPTVPGGKEEEHRALREGVLKGGASSGVEVQRRAKDGSLLDISLSTAPLRDMDGNVSGIVGMMADITERKRAEEAFREREEWLSTTLSSIGDAVIATDTAGRVTFLNPAAQSLTGWSQEEAFGRPLGEVFKVVREDTGQPVNDPVAKVMREGVVVGLANHTALVTRDGSRLSIEDSGAPIRDQHGNVTGVVLVFHDVTERRWAADELRRLTARLLEVQEDERRRVAYDIHDGLGQLLTAASMHLEAFTGYRDSADSNAADREFVKARRCLQEAVVEMRRMVSELGPLLLEDVGLVEASQRLLSDMAERIGWEAEFESEGPDDRLDGMAETALFRIVQEALANVAKHADSPKVRVAFRRERYALHLEVRDWGRGFGVPDKPERGRHVGLLGMRERAALVGGEFNVESSVEDGTRVIVTVPVAPPAARPIGGKKAEVVRMAEATKLRGSPRNAITVLIADDHPMVREGLRSMLDAQGIEVIGEAINGAEAVERAQQIDPDVVLMDVRMPDMDGLAATEIIKQTSPQTSVIVITSYESKEYLRRAIEAGAAGYLLKGMSRESLIDAIRLVKGGGSLIDARLLSELLKEMGVEGSRFQGVEGALEALTPREQEVLSLLVRGLTNKEIATEMHYSVGTVKNVVQRVIEKLGVSDRTQAAVYAVRAGVNPPT